MRKSENGFFPRVEALRGIAAIMVLAFHVEIAPWVDAAGPHWGMIPNADKHRYLRGYVASFQEAIFNGHAAVVLFFVISGFVLTLSLSRVSVPLPQVSFRFITARLFRIFPAIFGMVVVFVLLYQLFGASILGVPAEDYQLSNVIRQALLLSHTMSGVTWTLQLEVLAIPLILMLFILSRRYGDRVLAISFIGLAGISFAPFWNGAFGPSFLLNPACAFPAGMLIPTFGRSIIKAMSGQVSILLAVAIFLFFWAEPHFGWFTANAVIVEVIASFALVSALAYGNDNTLSRQLDRPIVHFYGRISYSLYLFAPLSLMIFWKIPELLGRFLATDIPSVVISWTMIALALAGVTPIAAASYYWVEKPGMALGRFINKRLEMFAPAVA